MSDVNPSWVFFWAGLALVVYAQLGTTAAGATLMIAALIASATDNRR